MRARRSSRSASGMSIVNGRIAVSPADFSAITAIWVLLRGRWFVDGTEPARRVSTSRLSEALGLLAGLHPGLRDPVVGGSGVTLRAKPGAPHTPSGST